MLFRGVTSRNEKPKKPLNGEPCLYDDLISRIGKDESGASSVCIWSSRWIHRIRTCKSFILGN